MDPCCVPQQRLEHVVHFLAALISCVCVLADMHTHGRLVRMVCHYMITT
jgi:hypothetical protein